MHLFFIFFQSPPSLLSQCRLVFESLTSQPIAEDEPHLVNVEALGERQNIFFQWLFSYLKVYVYLWRVSEIVIPILNSVNKFDLPFDQNYYDIEQMDSGLQSHHYDVEQMDSGLQSYHYDIEQMDSGLQSHHYDVDQIITTISRSSSI